MKSAFTKKSIYGYKSRILAVLPWIAFACTFVLAMIYQCRYAKEFLNSDLAAEMLLAKELNDSKSILFAENWFYSTELRVLYQHIPLRFGLLLFPDNWYMVRVFGQGVMLLLHGFSFIYLLTALGYRRAGIYGAAALMCPFGYWYLFHGIYGGQYLAHMILISFSTGLILQLVNERSKVKKGVLYVLLMLLCLLQGMGGIRMLMNLYVPLFTAVILVCVIRFNEKPFDEKISKVPQIKIILPTMLATVVCTIGYWVNANILSEEYVFASFNNRIWHSFSIQNIMDTYAKFLSLFGYPYEPWAKDISATGWTDITLMSVRGILSAFSIVLICALLWAVIRLAKLWKQLDFPSQVVYSLFLACLAVDGVVYALLESNLNGSYWLPIVPLAFAVVIIWIKNETFRLKNLYGGVSDLSCCYVLDVRL